MATKIKTTSTTDENSSAKVTHSPTTLAVGRCRLAAIAAIAEPAYRVALAFTAQAEDELAVAEASAADDAKDTRQLATARRWVLAATAAANATNENGIAYR